MTEKNDARLERLDSIDLEKIADFESEDFEEDDDEDLEERNAYLAGVWSQYGFNDERGTDEDLAKNLVVAHEMCQNYVDAFATEYDRYRVVFDPTMSSAGTVTEGRIIAITPKPVYDETITPQTAGLVLTGMSTHEVAHVRYGQNTRAAIRRVFGDKRAPNMLSNLLDDVRIERRFGDDYPGYRGVFGTMLAYVGRRRATPPSMDNLVNLAIRAVRFAPYEEWPTKELRDERDWWRAWADTWSKHDSPRRHVEAVREGLRHIVLTQEKMRRVRQEGPSTPMSPDQKRIYSNIKGLNALEQRVARMLSEGRSGGEIGATLGLGPEDARTLIRSVRVKMTRGRPELQLSPIASRFLGEILADMRKAGEL